MKYRVILQPRVLEELQEAYEWIAARAPHAALKWYEGFVDHLATLGENPRRCGLAIENGCIAAELRQLTYGKRSGRYRAVFTVQEDVVRVLHVRHAARPPLTEAEFDDLF